MTVNRHFYGSEILFLVCLCAYLSIFWGCSDPENTDITPERQCTFDSECTEKFAICDATKYICIRIENLAQCAKPSDCGQGQWTCQLPGGNCINLNADAGLDMGVLADIGENYINSGLGPDVEELELPAPIVAKISPEPESVINTNPEIKIFFNQKLDPTSVNQNAFTLTDLNDQPIALSVDFDPLTASVILKPKRTLDASSPYFLKVKDSIKSEQGKKMDMVYEYIFYTDDALSDDFKNLVSKWSPVIYQEIRTRGGAQAQIDWPSRIDFDGNWTAADNLSSIDNIIDKGAYLYYHITASKTQYFIYYVAYYPARNLADNTRHEHDFTGLVLVIDKAQDKLLIAEGLRVDPTSSDLLISYIANGNDIKLPGKTNNRSFFDTTSLKQGTHYPLYIPEGQHQACNWHDESPSGLLLDCGHKDNAFLKDGVVLKEGTKAGLLSEASKGTDGLDESTYKLLPLSSWLWTRRNNVGPTKLFASTKVYQPRGDRPAGYTPDLSHSLPRKLVSNDTESAGKTPFGWLALQDAKSAGQWMIDPAYELKQRYTLPNSISWSEDYCENLFLGIHDTTSSDCP